MTMPAPEAHLDPHEVTGYIEGTLARAERARLESHLADCDECTAEIAAVSRLRPRRGSRGRWVGLAIAAAAVIAVVVVGRTLDSTPADEGPVVRGDSAGAVVSTVAPAEGAALESPPVFVWHPVPDATIYRLSLTRPNGDSAWAASVRDTTVAAPDSALAPGTYYWIVDALLSDGAVVSGKAREFRIGP
jgi:hypothetical protein